MRAARTQSRVRRSSSCPAARAFRHRVERPAPERPGPAAPTIGAMDTPSAAGDAAPDAAGAPYSGLTPDVVLDALESVGLRGDGRLLALNSYENRVYQVGMEERQLRPGGRQVLPPGALDGCADPRRTRLRLELAEREIPVVAPLDRRRQDAARLRRLPLHDLPAPGRPRAGTGRPRHAGMDGALHRPHPCGRRARALRPSPHARHRDLRRRSRAITCSRTASSRPIWTPPGSSVVEQALRGRAALLRARRPGALIRLHGDCHAGNVLWTDDRPALRRFRRLPHGPGGAGPVDAAVRRPRRR